MIVYWTNEFYCFFFLKQRMFGTNLIKDDSLLLNERLFSNPFLKKISFSTERMILLNDNSVRKRTEWNNWKTMNERNEKSRTCPVSSVHLYWWDIRLRFTSKQNIPDGKLIFASEVWELLLVSGGRLLQPPNLG